MRPRKGKNGPFWSCSQYPECKGAASVEAAPRAARKTSARRKASA
jgi:DNA topoisomerase-3